MTRKNRLKQKVLPFALHMEAIGDISRMSILYILAHGPQDVREIIDITGIPASLMSHHLRKLYQSEWVTKKKFGKRVEYALEIKGFDILEKLFRDTPVFKEKLKAQS